MTAADPSRHRVAGKQFTLAPIANSGLREEIGLSTIVPRCWPIRSAAGSRRGEGCMRFILGLIVGCALTVGGAYIADSMASSQTAGKMVNWDVVAKNLDTVSTLAKEGWKKITG
jgi:hypothetical protein